MRTFFSKFFLITFCVSMVLVVVTSCSKEEEMGLGGADPAVIKNASIPQKEDTAGK